ncbi:MAG: metallophosphoesterase [Phycisphaerae bacterium]
MQTGTGCGTEGDLASLRSLEDRSEVPVNAELLLRIAHLSDAQLVDEESPGRQVGFQSVVASAWRPHESFTLHLLDGVVRAVNRHHVSEGAIDLLVHTGDAVDNAQQNELTWFLAILDGQPVNPTSGIDTRPDADRPMPLEDPHLPFAPMGLYRHGIHGSASTIPWYGLLGNHDRFAQGLWPVISLPGDRLVAPLPLRIRFGLFTPRALDPESAWSFAPVTPGQVGPPAVFLTARPVPQNGARRFLRAGDFVAAHQDLGAWPRAEGVEDRDTMPSLEDSWYVVDATDRIRIIGLNTSDPDVLLPRSSYVDGAIGRRQAAFLEAELNRAMVDDVWVIVMTHHPSSTLQPAYGSAYSPKSFRALLRSFSCVKIHLCGHLHVGMIFDQGGYFEMLAPSIIDPPHEGQVVELYRAGDQQAVIRYFRLGDDAARGPAPEGEEQVFEDPFESLRDQARERSAAWP